MNVLHIKRKFEIKNGINYLNKCLKRKYDKNKLIILNKHPKISVIITIYNCEKTIISSISSIQYQSVNEIEIIINPSTLYKG